MYREAKSCVFVGNAYIKACLTLNCCSQTESSIHNKSFSSENVSREKSAQIKHRLLARALQQVYMCGQILV